jgi:hypothetical protein
MLALTLAVVLAQPVYPAVMDDKGCTSCHDSASPDRDPKALSVFDLDRRDWPRQIPAPKLPSVARRLKQKGATPEELAEVAAFIERARQR